MRISLFIFMILVYSNSNCQSKQLRKTVEQGAKGVYYTEFEKPYKIEEIEKWCMDNGYRIFDYKEKDFIRFGDAITGVQYVRFMTQNDYFALQQRNQRQAELERNRQKEEDDASWVKLGAAVVGTAAVLVAGAKALSSNATEGSEKPKNYDYQKTEQKSTSCYSIISEKIKNINGQNVPWMSIKCHESNSLKELYYWTKENEKIYRKEVINPLDTSSAYDDGYYEETWGHDWFYGPDKVEAINKICGCKL